MGDIKKRTYPRVIDLLEQAVKEKGQRAVSRETRVPLLSIQRFLKGMSEPTTATLEKLAKYFDVTVAELRGEDERATLRDFYSIKFPDWELGLLAYKAFRMAKDFDGTLDSIIWDLEGILNICQNRLEPPAPDHDGKWRIKKVSKPAETTSCQTYTDGEEPEKTSD